MVIPQSKECRLSSECEKLNHRDDKAIREQNKKNKFAKAKSTNRKQWTKLCEAVIHR